MVSSDYNEHMLELRANGLRSKGQSSRFLEDDCHNVVANMSLPQQLSSQTTMKNYHKLFTHALSNILIFLLWFCDYISSKFIWTLISSILNKFRNVLFFGHTMDVLPPFISVLCHSDWLFHRESCPRLDVVHPGSRHGRTFSIYLCPLSFWLTLSQGVLTTSWCCPSRLCVIFLACMHLSLHYLFLEAACFPHGVTILCNFPCFDNV